MRFFARWIEHALDVAVQRSNDADAREHRWTVMFCNQQKRPHRGLPFGTMFCLGPITSAVGTERTWRNSRWMSVIGATAENICSQRVFRLLTPNRHWA
jgi:hypothetical protein